MDANLNSKRAGWETHYQDPHPPWETGHPSTELQRVVAEEKVARGRALDIGCGSGINAVWLAQQGFDVVGIDFSTIAIERARARARAAGVRVDFREADIGAAPDLGGPFRFFLDRGCYHVFRRDGQTAAYFQALTGWTAPHTRGLVLAGNAREKMEPGPPVVSEEELRGDWEPAFTIHWLRELRFDQNLRDPARPLGWSAWVERRA